MVYFDGATVLSPTHLGTVAKGQDGAIYNNYADHNGDVYRFIFGKE